VVMVRRSRATAAWWRDQRALVAAAVAAAEEESGHQIVVVVRRLGSDPAASASRLASRFTGATVVFCVDPVGRTFDVRWDGEWAVPAEFMDDLSRTLADSRLADAVTLVGRVIPRRDFPGRDLPDILDDES